CATYGFYHSWIEVWVGHLFYQFYRLVEWVCGLVVAWCGECIEDVSRCDDARANVDVVGVESPGISLPIHTLVVLRRDHRHLAHVEREDETREELRGLLGVRLHVRELGLVELSRLLEELVAHRDLAVVVQQRRGL